MNGRWLGVLGAVLLGGGFLLGRAVGPAPMSFPESAQGLSAAEMETSVLDALAEPRSFVRASRLTRLFEGLTVDNAVGAGRAVATRAARWDPVDLQVYLGARMLLDPDRAVEEVLAWPTRARREIGLKIALREWAASGRRLEAVDFVQTSLDPQLRGLVAGPLVRGWALSGDFEGALDLARRLSRLEGRLDVVDGLARGVLHVGGTAAALDLVREADPELGEAFLVRLHRATFHLVAREDPEVAAAFYQESLAAAASPPVWLEGMLDRLAEIWRNEDSAGAVDWLLALPRSEERDRVLGETMADWGIRDFDETWTWFRNERGPFEGTDTVVADDAVLLAALLPKMARTRPEQAAAWVVRLEPGPIRDAMLIRVARFWAASDLRAARRWIARLDGPESLRERIRALVEAEGQTSGPETSGPE